MTEKWEMTQEEFESALARFGPEQGSWPDPARRDAAPRLTQRDAQAAMRAAAELEGAFAELRARPVGAPDALLARVMADAADVAAARPAPRGSRPGWRHVIAARVRAALSTPALRPAMACAACAVFGLWLGQTAMIATAATTLFPADQAAGVMTFSDDGFSGVEIALGYGEEGWE